MCFPANQQAHLVLSQTPGTRLVLINLYPVICIQQKLDTATSFFSCLFSFFSYVLLASPHTCYLLAVNVVSAPEGQGVGEEGGLMGGVRVVAH